MSEAILNTKYGGIKIEDNRAYYWSRGEDLSLGDAEATIRTPKVGDVYEAGISVAVEEIGANAVGDVVNLICFAADLASLIDDANADAIEAERIADAEREEQEARMAAERELVIKERTEILLNELVGEKVKVRHKHYKTMCYAVVQVIAHNEDNDTTPTTYSPRLRWTDQGYSRGYSVDSFARLDVKTTKGWRTVWDDGKDDLPEYDRGKSIPKAKPYR